MRAIKDLTSWKNYEIAEKLGVTEETISKGRNGKTPSNQLLCGLKLLLELETLKRQPPPETAEQKVARLEARLNAMEKSTGKVTYPEPTTGHYRMNEKPTKKPRKKPPATPVTGVDDPTLQ